MLSSSPLPTLSLQALARLSGQLLLAATPEELARRICEALPPELGVSQVRLWSGEEDLSGAPLVLPLTDGVTDVPWGALAFWDEDGLPEGVLAEGIPGRTRSWEGRVRPALEEVAALAGPALRSSLDRFAERQREQEQRDQLQRRLQAKTHDLSRVSAELNTLYDLSQEFSGAPSIPDLLACALPALARVAGAEVCALWRLPAEPGEHGAPQGGGGGAECVAAYSPGHHDLSADLRATGPARERHLRQAVDLCPPGGILTRTLWVPPAGEGPGEQLLIAPIAAGLADEYVLQLQPSAAGGNLTLFDAAARAFGLVFGRATLALQLEQAAPQDRLTGLGTRTRLLSDLTRELTPGGPPGLLALCLLEVQLPAGSPQDDELLREVAARLRGALGPQDRLYRLGGPLFAALSRHSRADEREALTRRLSGLALELQGGPSWAFPPTGGVRMGRVLVSHAYGPDEAMSASGLLRLGLDRLGSAARRAGRPGPWPPPQLG